MRRLIYVLVILSAGLIAGCRQTANVEQERSALLALDREWVGTVKDPDKYFSYFAQDGNMYAAGMPKIAGAQAIRKEMKEMMSMPGLVLQWTPDKAEVSTGGDVGYTAGSYTVTVNNTAGMPVTETGKYVTIWKKQADGQWKVTEDIFNSDAPMPPPSVAHAMVAPSALKWGPPPPSLPPGSQFAVISGDPSKAEPFTVRAQLPAGYRIAPHWHPADENVTVLSGTFGIGMGDTFDEGKLTDLTAGGYVGLPGTMRHYVLAKTATTIQVHGTGPLVLNYVNPADDPSKK